MSVDGPMSHSEAEALLPGYQAGSLSREKVRALHQHFKDCEACRTRIRLQRAVSGQVSADDDRFSSPEIQKQMARNRDLLVKILILFVFALLVWRLRR